MVFRVVLFVWEFLMDVLAVSRLSDEEKEPEFLLLRQQLRIGERRQEHGPQIPRWQKMPVVATYAIWHCFRLIVPVNRKEKRSQSRDQYVGTRSNCTVCSVLGLRGKTTARDTHFVSRERRERRAWNPHRLRRVYAEFQAVSVCFAQNSCRIKRFTWYKYIEGSHARQFASTQSRRYSPSELLIIQSKGNLI
jgi:hypothetical protein